MSEKIRKPKTPLQEKLRFIFGSYSPPGFILAIQNFLTTGSGGAFIRKAAAATSQFVKARRWIFIGAAIALFVGGNTFLGYRFWLSRQPQPIEIGYGVQPPSNDMINNTIEPLELYFNGSAAPSDMAGKEVTSGITITPAIPGTWKWIDDTILSFQPSRWWDIGTRYSVTMDKSVFPDHVKIKPSFTFDIDDFSLSLSDAEFYIDPEDSKIKRVMATLYANYPIDSASLEGNIEIKPELRADSGSLRNRPYQYSVSYSKDLHTAYIVSEPLGMPARSTIMNISVKSGVKSTVGGSTSKYSQDTSVEIPGATSYVQVLGLTHELIKTPDQKYDQVFILETRGEIDSTELLKNVTVWELPVDRPELPGLRANKNHNWNTDEMLPQVLALSRKITPEILPNDRTYSPVNSFRFVAEPNRQIFVQLNNGARFYGDYFLNESWGTVFRVKAFPKEVSILSEGTVLSLSGDKKLAMLTRGIRDLQFNVGRVRPDDINHLVSQSNGDLNNFRFTNYRFGEFNVTTQYNETITVPVNNDRDLEYFSFDFSRYLGSVPDKNLRYGLFIFQVQGTGNNSSYADKRLIMVTDLGFFVKQNTDGTRALFVQSIASGAPVSGATVEIIGLNGNVIFSSSTGYDGYVSIPDLSSYTRERLPTAFVVRRGEDMSFMPFSANGRMLDYSAFDTGGIYGATDPKKLNAFLFSDRGIYRPGDEVRLGLIIKAGDWNINLERTPLEYRVVDPKGTEIFNQRIALSRAGFEEIKFSTQDWSPTGTYTASVYVIREDRNNERVFLGSQTVKVEEFLPETLTVSAVFDPLPKNGWISPSSLAARISVRNLFGTAAAGNEVKAQITLSPGHQYFRQYRDYTFLDPFIKDKNFQEFLGSQTTAEDGTCQFEIDVAKFEQATYNLTFYTEAFEKGSGRNVSTEATVMVSPLSYLIGYKADGSLSYINRDSKRVLSFIAIDPELKKIAVRDLTLTLTELRYVSMLVKQPNGVYKYQSVRKAYPVSSETINVPAAGLEYSLPTGQSGEYELVVTAPDGLVYNKAAFSVAGDQNIERSLTRTAELELSLKGTDFAGGDTIEVMIKAPYAGSGLITIERDKVYAHKWFTSSGATSVQTITLPQELEGNGYINVLFVRAQDSREIFMSPLSYGTVPFSVSKDSRTNRITLDIAAEAKSGRDFPIRYSTSRPGKIVIYAVDEGILQLAGYKTPDPIAFFFQKRALEVRTSQIMDLILPEYSVVRALQAMGGGGGYDELSRNLNPFKRRQNQPVAYWSGILDSGPQAQTVNYRVPDYFNGTLRVMAVAVSDATIGATDDKALIRNTFIISPNSPMMAAPGDEFEVSVTVTNNQKGVGEGGKVRLQATGSKHLTITSASTFDLSIPEGRDQTITLTVKAAGPVGAAEIKFLASNAGESSELAAYLSVRPAVPYRVALQTGVLKRASVEVAVPRKLYEEFSTRDIALSYLPLGLAKGLNFYLSSYPYGCSEQITSAAFPFLYPELFRELGFTREQGQAAVARVISILQARAKQDRSIGIWTALSESDPYITTYCAHFLTEAKLKGYYVSPTFMNNTLQALKNIAQGSGTSSYDLTNRSYAIYVLTLNEQVTTTQLEALKRDIGRGNAAAETGFPGLYMAGSYAMLQQDFEASTLLGKIKRDFATDASYRYLDQLSYQSLYLNMLARHFPRRVRDVSASLLESMAAQLQSQDYTTLSASMALMAIDSYLKAVPSAETGTFTLAQLAADKTRTELTPRGTPIFSSPYSGSASVIAINNRDPIPLFYQVTQAGFDLALPTAETKNGIEVYREFTDANGRKITTAAIGDTVYVKLNFRSLSGNIRDVALVDLLPAGLEADTASIRDTNRSGWTPDYVDIREDRIVVFGSVNSSLNSYTYQARAINKGSFTVPPLFAEALYDKSVWALRPQEKLVITE